MATSLWQALESGSPTIGSLPKLPSSYTELARLTGRSVDDLKKMSKGDLKVLPIVGSGAAPRRPTAARSWPTIGSINPLPSTYSEMAFLTGRPVSSLKALPRAELRELPVVAVGDLQPLPVAYTSIAAMTMVPVESVRAMRKDEMRRLAVVRRAECVAPAPAAWASLDLPLPSDPSFAAEPPQPSDPFAGLDSSTFSPPPSAAAASTRRTAAPALARAKPRAAPKAKQTTRAVAPVPAAATLPVRRPTSAAATPAAAMPTATPAAATPATAPAIAGAPPPPETQASRKAQLREKLKRKREALAAEKRRMATVQHELELLETPIRPAVTRCRAQIESIEAELHAMRATFKGVRVEHRKLTKLNEERRAEKALLAQHLALILAENEKTKDEMLLSLEDQLEGAATHSASSVQWTSVLKAARKNLRKAAPTTHYVKVDEVIRFGPVRKGVAFAWDFSVRGGAQIDFAPKFFRSASCLATSCALRVRTEAKSGTYVAPEDGVLLLEFDNAFSWFANKTVTLRCAASVKLEKPAPNANAAAAAAATAATAVAAAVAVAAAAAAVAAPAPKVTAVAVVWPPNTVGSLPALPSTYGELSRLTDRTVAELKRMAEGDLKSLPMVAVSSAASGGGGGGELVAKQAQSRAAFVAERTAIAIAMKERGLIEQCDLDAVQHRLAADSASK